MCVCNGVEGSGQLSRFGVTGKPYRMNVYMQADKRVEV